MPEKEPEFLPDFPRPRTELEILSEANPNLIFAGLEDPAVIFDKAELGKRVLAALELFGDEPVA